MLDMTDLVLFQQICFIVQQVIASMLDRGHSRTDMANDKALLLANFVHVGDSVATEQAVP
jgi:hypothetical protein